MTRLEKKYRGRGAAAFNAGTYLSRNPYATSSRKRDVATWRRKEAARYWDLGWYAARRKFRARLVKAFGPTAVKRQPGRSPA